MYPNPADESKIKTCKPPVPGWIRIIAVRWDQREIGRRGWGRSGRRRWRGMWW